MSRYGSHKQHPAAPPTEALQSASGFAWKHEVMLLSVVLIWGLNFPVLKAALGSMHLLVLNAFRFIVSIIVLGTLYYLQQRRSGRSFFSPLRTHGRQIAGLGLLGFLLYQLCFIIGIDHTKAGNAALIMASVPLWTALVGFVLRIERLSQAAWIGLLVTLAGTAVIVIGGSKQIDFSSSTFLGNLIMLAAAVCWGAYTALSRPILRDVPATGLTFLGLLFAFPFLLGIAVPHLDTILWDQVSIWSWMAIIFSGGLSTGLAVALWNTGVHHAGASQTAVFGNLVPLAALLSSLVLLGEAITMVQVAGGTLILGGVVTMRRSRGT